MSDWAYLTRGWCGMKEQVRVVVSGLDLFSQAFVGHGAAVAWAFGQVRWTRHTGVISYPLTSFFATMCLGATIPSTISFVL